MKTDDPTRTRTLIVVVLYGMKPHESSSVQCLQNAIVSHPAIQDAYDLLLWDNSPDAPGEAAELKIPYRYHWATDNDGVSGAFNGAVDVCEREGYAFMLLLDQDTEVTVEYLEGMQAQREIFDDDQDVAAVAPLLFDRDMQLSPKRVRLFRDMPVAPAPARLLEGEVFAANSGVMVRVSSLLAIGGYSLDFWMDHSDMYVFHQFHLRGWRIFLAADLRLQHSMTMLDYDTRMTPARYDNFLHAEQAFIDLYKNGLENAAQLLRLLIRSVRQRRYRDKIYSTMTLRFLLKRLKTSKTKRLQAWKQRRFTRQRSIDMAKQSQA
jgi:GT2 family glycosyltransferase